MSNETEVEIPTAFDNEPKPEKPKRGRRRLFLRLLVLVVVVAVIAWALWYYLDARWYQSTDDAYVKGNVVQITPQVPGTVVSIGAEDGDLVREGQVLVMLDPSDAGVALAEAKANLAHAVRQVRGLYNNVQGAKADVAARKVALDAARADYQRRKGLAATGAISAEELAHARDALDAARSALTVTTQHYDTSKVLVENTVVASNPEVKATSAKLRAAYLNDVRTTLVAPVTGYVAKRSVQVGQRVQPGLALMAVVPLHQVWVNANFKETQLQNMRIGQPVTMQSDLYGGSVTFHGKIESLGVGTGSAFSLLPAQNASGNWIKIVQRVPVRIGLRANELDKHPLRIGLSISADVNLHDQSGLMLSQTPPNKPLFTTNVYKQHLSAADTLIKNVIDANMGGAGHAK